VAWQLAKKIILAGKAYMDDTPQEKMQAGLFIVKRNVLAPLSSPFSFH